MLRSLSVFLIIAGILAVLLGLFLRLGEKYKGPGRLPGDILIQKGNFTFYFPLATCLLASLVLTLVLVLVFKFLRK